VRERVRDTLANLRFFSEGGIKGPSFLREILIKQGCFNGRPHSWSEKPSFSPQIAQAPIFEQKAAKS
jgi:hypothetical protein